MKCSIIDYALFRARYVMKFEGELREGLAGEFTARDRIKRASHISTYLFCSPLWPLHILWELPLAGAEKERSLDKEGISLVLPSVEPGGIGEIPCRMDDTGVLDYADFALPDTGWQGAGLLMSYQVRDKIHMWDMFPGWPREVQGSVLLILDSPADTGYFISSNDPDMPKRVLSHWPGRYEWALGRIVHVHHGGGSYLSYRRTKVRSYEEIEIWAYPLDGHQKIYGIPEEHTLENAWPVKGSIIRQHPWVMYIIGIIICYVVFHIVNIFLLRIKYPNPLSGAIYDPVVSHIFILVFATILLPLFGLGWIAGAYLAGRYLHWRHPGAKYTWGAMLTYVLVTTAIFELVFANPLWV